MTCACWKILQPQRVRREEGIDGKADEQKNKLSRRVKEIKYRSSSLFQSKQLISQEIKKITRDPSLRNIIPFKLLAKCSLSSWIGSKSYQVSIRIHQPCPLRTRNIWKNQWSFPFWRVFPLSQGINPSGSTYIAETCREGEKINTLSRGTHRDSLRKCLCVRPLKQPKLLVAY